MRIKFFPIYEQIDNKEVYKYVVEGTADIESFIDDITAMISQEKD